MWLSQRTALVLSTLGGLSLGALGCGARPWQPPPPHGTTYVYDHQGFRSSDTTVVGGTRGGFPAYGAAFSFRDAKGVHPEQGGKEPFAQSAPIDGVRFNPHLQGQGAQLTPSSGAGGAAGVTNEPSGATGTTGTTGTSGTDGGGSRRTP